MILPNRIVVFTKKYTLFFLIGLSPIVIGDELDYKEKLKLKEIQSRVINVNKKIEKAKERVRKLGIELGLPKKPPPTLYIQGKNAHHTLCTVLWIGFEARGALLKCCN